MDEIVDLASAAAGIATDPSASLHKLPSDREITHNPAHRELALLILVVTARVGAHTLSTAANWAASEAALFAGSDGLSGRFARWEPSTRGVRMKERVKAVIDYFFLFQLSG